MKRREYKDVIIIDADEGKYLAIPNVGSSEELIGKPSKLILRRDDRIPEFVEREV